MNKKFEVRNSICLLYNFLSFDYSNFLGTNASKFSFATFFRQSTGRTFRLQKNVVQKLGNISEKERFCTIFFDN